MLFVVIIPLRLFLDSVNKTFQNLTFFLGNLKVKNRFKNKAKQIGNGLLYAPLTEFKVPGPALITVDEIARVRLHSHIIAQRRKLD